MNTPASKTSNELAVERTDLAFRRTVMAADRTLMAWVRTALSTISFGFTVYKILDMFHERTGSLRAESTPREVGMFMTALGIAALALGIIEFVANTLDLRKEAQLRLTRPSFIMAVVVLAAGIALFFGIQGRVV